MAIPFDEIRRYMLLAYDLDMTSGDYVFFTTNIVPENDWTYGNESWIGQDERDEEARIAMEALLHVRKLQTNRQTNKHYILSTITLRQYILVTVN